ncbi:MAG: AAA family ATPase [Bacteroidota bacterium]
MYYPRQIDEELKEWKSDSERKPLLIRGARQVGKTESVREFSKSFEVFIELNFETDKRVCAAFSGSLDPYEICENISLLFGISIVEGNTLLFLDEIQSCIPAIQSLRFFYEKMAGLHVIAAGSLLEFALKEIPSFGVGRIRSIFMYPMSFNEFLIAAEEETLLNRKRQAGPELPLPEILHDKLTSYLKRFLITGGLPEVVSLYIQHKDFNKCMRAINDFNVSVNDDFSKYSKRIPVSLIREVFDSVVMQSGRKFIYSKATRNANHSQIKEALDLLVLAGMVLPVKHTSGNGIPLGAEVNLKKQKMLLHDTGVFQRILNLDVADIAFSQDFNVINRGNIAEQFTGIEMLKYASVYDRPNLYYWQREAKNSNAEIDYLITRKDKIFPLEVKAGTKGAMQSLFLFLKEKSLNKGIRVSLENFSNYSNIEVYPLYAIENLISG